MKRKAIIRILTITLAVVIVLMSSCSGERNSQTLKGNLAVLATPSQMVRGSMRMMKELNDGMIPDSVNPEMRRWLSDPGRAARQEALTVAQYQYEWEEPVTIDEAALFLYDYESLTRLPVSYRFKYWNGDTYVDVEEPMGLNVESGIFNHTRFRPVSTTRLLLELDSVERFLSPLLEWQVFKPHNSPDPAPVVIAGPDRLVVTGGKTWLTGIIRSITPLKRVQWEVNGPGRVRFENRSIESTTATFTDPGDYVLTLTSKAGKLKSSSSLKVTVVNPPGEQRLDVVYTGRFKIDSPLWNDRAKALIVNWIPHCIEMIEKTDLDRGQGGLDNFIEAARALRGESHGRHLGYVFSNAWVHQTVESMCIALMVDPQGDREIIAAQEMMKRTLEKWIPVILAAQEPDGYLQTAYTLRDTTRWKERWAPETRSNHEGYVAGYFIESAINHYTLTEGADTRLYDAAKRLADCWVDNIGPGKREWYDGHQEMEQALVRFGRFVNDMEGNGRGDSYITLAKFLLDSRGNGSEYDQSHLPVQQQYEAVGHAVRAVYNYSAMADVAAETGDTDYQSAVITLWDNMVNKKYYVTGGIGSGETSEGFGVNYSLPNSAYCESCSSCGLIFFQYKMNLAYHDAKYADLYEETIYNALLGSIDHEGKNFYYTNPLASNRMRSDWHVCPCCVGNIPRTLLMIPTWTYAKSEDGIYVNLFIGSTINIDKVAGTDVEMVQKTDYPWKGEVSITVNPAESRNFTVWVRIPDRKTSDLYTSKPELNTIGALSVNGEKVDGKAVRGYIPLTREWKRGDVISFVIPMEVQQVTADERIVADRGKIALRYGPLVYNVEKADQPDIEQPVGDDQFIAVWDANLFGGIMTIRGRWSDGSDLLAIPNYLRLNRVTGPDAPREGDQQGDRSPSSLVWINKR